MLKIVIIFLVLFSSLLQSKNLDLVFDGNENFSSSTLYDAIDIETPFFYAFWEDEPKADTKEAHKLASLVKDYYRYSGFFHTSTKPIIKDNKIIISIKENIPITITTMTVNSTLNINAQIPFKVGDIFDSEKFKQSKKNIKLFYGNHTYCKIKLDSKAWIDTQTNSAYLAYDVTQNEKCIIGDVTIISPESIDTSIIKSLLYLRKGQPFSTKLIKDSYDSLYAGGGISKALIHTSIDENSNKVNVTVTVEENNKPTRLETGLGVNTDEGLMVSLSLENKNMFGNLKTLGLSSRVTKKKQNIKTYFNMPLSHRNSTGIDIGYENEEFIGYKEERVFANIYLSQRKEPHRLTESIVFDNSNTYESDDLVLFPRGKLFITSPKLHWAYDTRDDILNPKRGHFLISEVMGSIKSTLSDASYYKFKVKGGYIMPLENSIIAVQATFGSLNVFDGRIPASYRFYSGGINSNRAYNYNSLGPENRLGDPIGFRSIFETILEYRYPIFQNVRGVVFSDTTFIGQGDIPEYDNGYYSAGIGFRYETPLGPLALDFGFDIDRPKDNHAIQFRIGEVF